MSKISEEQLLALKTKYLAAHAEYDRCVAALSEAGLRSVTSLNNGALDRLSKAFFELRDARTAYRTALFGVAFNEPLN